MLAVMKAKLQASRAILYETTRFVDIYKSYGFLADTRKLTPEERQDMKKYQRYADMFTPVLKMTRRLRLHEGVSRRAHLPRRQDYHHI